MKVWWTSSTGLSIHPEFDKVVIILIKFRFYQNGNIFKKCIKICFFSVYNLFYLNIVIKMSYKYVKMSVGRKFNFTEIKCR